MAQQKIIRSRLKKVLSSSTSSLVPHPSSSLSASSSASLANSRRFEITLNPFFHYQWPPQPPHQPQAYQHLFLNQNGSGSSRGGVYLYNKDYLCTRSLTDLRITNGRASIMNPGDDDDLDDSDLGQEDSGDHSLEKRSTATLRKGLLWQQRDKFFSQWKERYFILTPDYLQCFKKGTSRITEMGEFIYKIKLCELEDVELLDRRGYLVLSFTLQKEGKVYLRKTEGIRDWFNALKESMEDSKKRWNDRASKNFWSAKQLTDSSSIEKWLQARKKIGVQYSYLNNDAKSKSDVSSVTDVSKDDKSSSTTKPAKSEITLDELSDLYRNEEEEERRKSSILTSTSSNVTSSSSSTTNIVQLRASRDDLSCRSQLQQQQQQQNGNAKQKKINRLSLMTDLELPDLGHDLISSDLERGIFKVRGLDNESSDSGNNSMNTNGSVASSNSSHSNHSNPREPRERLETHLESDQDQEGAENAREESKLKAVKRRVREENGRKYFGGSRRPSSHVMPNGLQVTHV